MSSNFKTFKFFLIQLNKFKLDFYMTVILIPLVYIIGGYLNPLILASILNKISNHQYTPHHLMSSFGSSIVLYILVVIASTMVTWRIFDIFYWRISAKVSKSIYEESFDHIMKRGADFHANEFSGSLVSRINKLAGAFERFTDQILFGVTPLVVGLVFVSIIMFPKAPVYTIILNIFTILYVVTAFLAGRRIAKVWDKWSASESLQTGYLADAITNVMAVKSFAREKYESQRFKKSTANVYKEWMSSYRTFRVQQLTFGSVTTTFQIVAFIAALVLVVDYGSSVATIFLIFNFTSTIIQLLFQFSNSTLRNLNRAFGDAKEMIEILNQDLEIKDPEQPDKLVKGNGSIEFKNVVFTHSGSKDEIFNNFNLDIKPGEKIGLVGHSGAGKSTLVRLVLRFSDLDSGEILINGQDISKIKQSDLHSLISYVPQEPLLFHRSIKENIAYGNETASEEEIIKVAKLAHADEFINGLPEGYKTLVGERGVKLSGGQRQRIAIARAMLKNSPILILDEATSALDSESEKLIQDALRKLMENKTTIAIAHRLSTVQKMDRILVLEDGSIAEQGNHHHLLEKNGIYAGLWEHQSGGFLED